MGIHSSIHSATKLIEIKKVLNQIESEPSLNNKEKDSAIREVITSELKIHTEFLISHNTFILQDEYAFAEEYNRLINNELIDEALRNGKNHFKSLTPCSNDSSGHACGNTVRYISNRGCTLCQSPNSTLKQDKNKRAFEILNEYSKDAIQAPIVKRLIESLNIKKSAAYRLVKLHRDGKPLYNTPVKSSFELEKQNTSSEILNKAIIEECGNNSSIYVDEFDIDQSINYDDEWHAA